MDGREELAVRFEAERGRLGAVARRMLGSTAEAEDAVQDAWLRLERVDAAELENLPGWLTTVVSRICLDVLRGRRTEPVVVEEAVDGPEAEAELVEEVGRAMLVVLDRLGPAERVAFVLHDGFAVPFDRIGPIVGRNTGAAKKLASRARQRVRGTEEATGTAVGASGPARREVVEAFLAAARGGDLDALLAVLAPEVVRRADPAALPAGRPVLLRGAGAVARETRVIGRRARFAVPVLVDGELCAAIAPDGRLRLLLRFEVADGRVAGFEVVADPARLAALELSLPVRDTP
ncbi:sigma-70 family RNA polymerase sigma factor [Kitasatospora purpeofusca]|uniref:sigma-70 family RNA polymerase sigma factor n=1 Tax=Kitasatospora purpeofusca TaxID=67352 RepID=UPI0038671655|nr:sigma-70 family RNA polymerase sigma factor [Kitasatospora purpeofusca]